MGLSYTFLTSAFSITMVLKSAGESSGVLQGVFRGESSVQFESTRARHCRHNSKSFLIDVMYDLMPIC